MTRINLVPPDELMDQHLFAEFREIKMVPKSLARSLKAAWQSEFDKNDDRDFDAQRVELTLQRVLDKVPAAFTLNTGHVSFFYDKGAYLRERYAVLREELLQRGINFNTASELDPDQVFDDLDKRFNKGYMPTEEALIVIRTRIAEKIAMKPSWYRYYGAPSK
jgi:deoxyribonuclease (pyrimidine dimer)